MFNIIVARKNTQNSKDEKIVEKEERQRTLLEKLGFAQMMFDFYTAPIE
jgi:hypothetical protein